MREACEFIRKNRIFSMICNCVEKA